VNIEAVLGFAGLFFALLALLALLAVMSGWPELAASYRATRPMVGRSFWFRSARIGLVGFRSCLVLNAELDGLGLRCLPPIPVLEPPLLLPWSDLTAEFLPGLVPEVVLRTAALPAIPIRLSGALFDRVLRAAGRSPGSVLTPTAAQ
jgi:hypothetical protein